MGKQDEIYRVLQYLQNEGIRATPDSDIPILLCAFNEDETKKKGNDSYAYNIERANEIIKRISSEEV